MEVGWKPTCEQAESAVRLTLASGAQTEKGELETEKRRKGGAEIEINWGGPCDLLKSLDGERANAELRARAPGQQLVLFLTSCSCVRPDEKAVEAATSEGGFFRSLLRYLTVGTLVLFIETTYNLAEAFGDVNDYGKKLERVYSCTGFRKGVAGVLLYRVVIPRPVVYTRVIQRPRTQDPATRGEDKLILATKSLTIKETAEEERAVAKDFVSSFKYESV